MEPVADKPTQEQQAKMSAAFEAQYGMSLAMFQALLVELLHVDASIDPGVAPSPGQHAKKIIESETGKTLPDDFVVAFDQGVKDVQDGLADELTDDDLDLVTGGADVISGVALLAFAYNGITMKN